MGLSGLVQSLFGNKEEIYKQIILKNLTPNQLRATIIPDEYLHYVLIQFASKTGRKYQLYHLTEPYKDAQLPSTLLLGFKFVDIADFGEVEKRIAQIVNGNLGKLIKDVEEGYSDDYRLNEYGLGRVIDVNHKPTQATIADFVEAYMSNFRNLSIDQVIFKNVPKSSYENSGLLLSTLPKENVIIKS